MKPTVFIVAVLVVLGSSAAAQETKTQCELVDAKYKSGEPSRIVLVFNEPVRFFQKKLGKNSIRLSFPNTGSEKYADNVPVIFKSGLAKILVFDFSREDTLAVVVMFRDHVAYDLRNSNNKIIVEMRASDSASVLARLVGIRSLAQEQISAPKANVSQAKSDSSSGLFETPAFIVEEKAHSSFGL